MNKETIERRRGGWFVFPSDPSIDASGPWKNKRAAELASEGKFEDAHKAEREGK